MTCRPCNYWSILFLNPQPNRANQLSRALLPLRFRARQPPRRWRPRQIRIKPARSRRAHGLCRRGAWSVAPPRRSSQARPGAPVRWLAIAETAHRGVSVGRIYSPPACEQATPCPCRRGSERNTSPKNRTDGRPQGSRSDRAATAMLAGSVGCRQSGAVNDSRRSRFATTQEALKPHGFDRLRHHRRHPRAGSRT